MELNLNHILLVSIVAVAFFSLVFTALAYLAYKRRDPGQRRRRDADEREAPVFFSQFEDRSGAGDVAGPVLVWPPPRGSSQAPRNGKRLIADSPQPPASCSTGSAGECRPRSAVRSESSALWPWAPERW
jgi:hypothetical protein